MCPAGNHVISYAHARRTDSGPRIHTTHRFINFVYYCLYLYSFILLNTQIHRTFNTKASIVKYVHIFIYTTNECLLCLNMLCAPSNHGWMIVHCVSHSHTPPPTSPATEELRTHCHCLVYIIKITVWCHNIY